METPEPNIGYILHVYGSAIHGIHNTFEDALQAAYDFKKENDIFSGCTTIYKIIDNGKPIRLWEV